jgi:type IV secretion system protein VirD4
MSRFVRRLLVLSLALFTSAPVYAQTAAYLNEMPPASRVVSDMRAGSTRESAVRATTALHLLSGIVRTLSGRQPSPADTAKMREYDQAAQVLFSAEEAKVGRPDPQDDNAEYYLLNRCQASYTMSAAFYREVLDRYFSPQWQAQYARRFASVSGQLWRDALMLPAGTKATLAPDAARNCADPSGLSLARGVLGSAGGVGERIASFLLLIAQIGGGLALIAAIGAGIGFLVLHKVRNSRKYVVRRNNREAMQLFGSDRQAREQAIIDAFDSPDYTFRYEGINRAGGQITPLKIIVVLFLFGFALTSPVMLLVGILAGVWLLRGGQKMRFLLLRNIRSFRRGDLEALRFAYLAFNRGLIDDEKFHWYRFTAIYAGGKTDPAEWKFSGLFGALKSKHGDIDRARATLRTYASGNAGSDIEAQALAAIQRLALEHPEESLYHDMRRRFVEGTYWLTAGELKRTVFAPSDNPYAVSFGKLEGTDAELVFAAEGSIMTIAPPGAGKTQCNVLPNLLRWPGPAVVLDVKGEIYDNTSAWRAANVGPVIKFSPLDPLKSARFNPLTGIRGESMYLWEDARFLAEMMIVPKAKEPFWEDKAKEILTAIIADVAFWNSPDDRAMSKVLSIINRNGWDDFIDRMKKNPEIQTMRDEGSNLGLMDPRTLDGALQTAKASLSAWVGERINHVTRVSDWNPLDLRNGTNPTIYVCVKPNEIDAYLSLLRVVIAQHIRALTSELPPRGAAPILFVLDELPRLRQMPPVEEALEVGRQYGIKLWMFAQSIGQMKNAYPNGEGMMGSCAVRTFMNPSLQDGTAKMLAEQIGHRSGEAHGGKDAETKNDTLVVDATQLAGPEFKDLQVVVGVGGKPAKVRKMFAHADPVLRSRMGAYQPAVRDEVAFT